MSLQEDIQKIMGDATLSYDEKGEKLAKLVTKQELGKLLSTLGKDGSVLSLKKGEKPSAAGRRTLSLSIHKVFFDQIILGTKKIEYRDWTNEYYQKKCSYVEGGKRYLVPFDALVLYVGRGKGALTATVSVTNITCDGTYLMFWLGRVLSTNSPLWKGRK